MRKKGKERENTSYKRLLQDSSPRDAEDRTPKGCVPMLVGKGPTTERFHVDVKLLKEPCMAAVLEMAAQELGRPQEGILRIPYDVDRFQRMVGVISAKGKVGSSS